MATILSPNKYTGRLKPIRVIVVHTMEVSEDDPRVAESVGNAFARPATRASAHIGVDTDSTVRYVLDGDTAWAAPGANADGLQLELAGRAGQTSGDWTDAASRAILERAAQQVAAWCRIYGIPSQRLSDAELGGGVAKGIVGHADVSRVFKLSTHWDPGKNFPWTAFLARVRAIAVPRMKAPMSSRSQARPPLPKAAPASSAPPLPAVMRVGSSGAGVSQLQTRLRDRGWKITIDGEFGDATRKVVLAFQSDKGLTKDGAVGNATWRALWLTPITR